MTGAQVYSSLKRRLRRPSIWAAFLAMYLPVTGVGLYFALRGGAVNPWLVVSTLTRYFLFVFCFTWLAPIPWQWDGRGGYRPVFVRGLLQSFIFSEGMMVFLVLIDAGMLSLGHIPYTVWGTLLVHLSFQGPALVLVGSLVSGREYVESEFKKIQAHAEEAELRLLQSQLHPHVLFNALNGLAELIHKDPPAAEQCVRSLSNLLRKVLGASDEGTFTLGQERDLVTDYLYLESMRLGKRLRIQWEWDPRLDSIRIPPLLLQPLVENAIKHGIACSRPGGELMLSARQENPELVLEVRNTGQALDLSRPSESGIGLRNLESRLALAYRTSARFSLRSEREWTVAEIRLVSGHLHTAYEETQGGIGR